MVTVLLTTACSDSTVTVAGDFADGDGFGAVADDSAPTAQRPGTGEIVELEMRCPGLSESSISEMDWPDSGPESAEAAIASHVDMLRAELAFRPDWGELELVDVTQSGTFGRGWFVDEDNVVRLIFNAESHDGVWLVTGWDSCSPG